VLHQEFEIDHFLPWSFVTHDEFWNLCPVLKGVNRNKSDHLPALDLYLPRLAALHAGILAHVRLPRALANAYAQFLGVEADGLAHVTPGVVEDRYQKLVRPLAQIAADQGFPTNWRNPSDIRAPEEFAAEGGG
jgi:hypothetical protein